MSLEIQDYATRVPRSAGGGCRNKGRGVSETHARSIHDSLDAFHGRGRCGLGRPRA